MSERSELHDAIERAIKEHCAGGDLWLCAHIASKPFDARIAELEQAVAIRDTEIARLETDLELARRDHASALRLVTDIRFALGDNGKRMQPGFVEWCRELRADAERMNWLEASTFSPVTRAAIDVARDGHQGNSDDDR